VFVKTPVRPLLQKRVEFFYLKCLLLSSEYNQSENMSLTLAISLLRSYVTVNYLAHTERRLDMANLIGEVL